MQLVKNYWNTINGGQEPSIPKLISTFDKVSKEERKGVISFFKSYLGEAQREFTVKGSLKLEVAVKDIQPKSKNYQKWNVIVADNLKALGICLECSKA